MSDPPPTDPTALRELAYEGTQQRLQEDVVEWAGRAISALRAAADALRADKARLD